MRQDGVDYDEMERLAWAQTKSWLSVADRLIAVVGLPERMRTIADEVSALLLIDMAHPAGLIAAGLLENPVKYAHIVYNYYT